MKPGVHWVTIPWRERAVEIELQWLGEKPGTDADAQQPLMVFLHEGLGSLSMWRDFPADVCARLGCRGLVFSRPGYGRSTPRQPDDHWRPDFLHQQAQAVLPALLAACGVDSAQQPIWLLGHSDGGSIALLHAARYPENVAGLVVMAPHIVAEDITLRSIEKARLQYLETDLRARLARFHQDPDSAFWGWNDIWLHPDFKDWNITSELRSITCPVLAIQGLDDAYGTLEQVRGIARQVPRTQLLELPDCGHNAHKDQYASVLAAIQMFYQQQRQETAA